MFWETVRPSAARNRAAATVPAGSLALAGAAITAVGLGLVASAGWDPHVGSLSSADLHRSLTVVGGSLLFGAGLLQMSMWRLGEDASRAYAGAALVVLGLITTLTSGTGHLLHDEVLAAALNPLTTAWAALASVALVGVSLTSGLRGEQPQLLRPSTAAAVLVTATAAGLSLLGELRTHVHVDLSLTPALQVQVEVVVAAAWAALAWLAHRRGAAGVSPVLPSSVMLALALTWGLRALAVGDLAGWSVASAVLLASVAVVALTSATSEFVDATEAEHSRAVEAERAVVRAAHELQQHDDETRALDHDARNMLLALRTATQTLADHGERLGEDTRHELERAIAVEAARLDALIADHARAARARQHGAPAVPRRGRVPAQRRTATLGVAR